MNQKARWALLVCVLAGACGFDPVDRATADAVAARECTPAELDAIRNGAPVTCSCTLTEGETITHPLVFEGDSASGVTFDGNGAVIDAPGYTIEVRSIVEPALGSDGSPLVEHGHAVPLKNDNGYYVRKRPENVTIKNCVIKGKVRVWGLGENGQHGYQWHSSRDLAAPGHVERARDAAPTRITFENVTIEGTGGILFYLGPGATYVTLKKSELKGTGKLNVYFDAETAFNVVTGNHIHANTNRGFFNQQFRGGDRELFALDGSSYNTITDNRFSQLQNGGIYLYRNCGECGAVRVSTPSHNRIANNYFYYNRYNGPNPAVWLGSRNTLKFDRYCGKDKDVDYGSGASDWDYAQDNEVRDNQIVKRSVSDMIVVGLDRFPNTTERMRKRARQVNSGNAIEGNTTVR
ncbi:MAG: right-handed parallel beta-helix repeat-containing protein [Thermomicrobiales bacterium]